MAANEQVNIIIKAKDDASKQIAGLNKQMTGLTGTVGLATKAFAALGGAMALKNIIMDVAKAAIEEEKQWNRVTASLRAANFEVNRALPVIQKLTDQLEWQTGIADELIAQGFNRLIPVVRNVGDAYRYLQTASDIAAAKGVDLNTVVEALIAAHQGHYTQLERLTKKYFPEATKAAGDLESIMADLNKQFAGQAQANMEGYAGEVKRWEIQMERFKENVGAPMLKFISDYLDGMQKVGASRGWTKAVFGDDEGKEDITKAADALKSLDIVLPNIITAIGSPRDNIPQAFLGEDPGSGLAQLESMNGQMRELTEHERTLRELRSSDGMAVLSKDMEQFGPTPGEVRIELMQREMAVVDELVRKNQEAFRKVSSAARSVLSPLTEWMIYGARIGDSFAAMGQRIKQVIADAIINMLAEAIAKAVVFRGILAAIGIGAAPATGGASAAAFMPFDDRHNDSLLTREVRWMGELITRGITQGMAAGMPNGSWMQQPQMAAAAPAPINLNFYGPVTSEQFVHDTIIPAVERAAKNNRTQIKLNDTHLTGKRDGFSY